ncbi:hypothetical protein [Curtobacterium sp. 20TX0008]|uniref:hypothetical protein n=1 Tax=Curtobacterium sp. 20TX0008 TaxID=3022018 RepID=UPI00232BF7F1|nr:hypothetical protein [Curtobacterium sp. 20TX0008]MDB6425931.1 hypothetical protein [Curtobacterium sp. 20TX0008]
MTARLMDDLVAAVCDREETRTHATPWRPGLDVAAWDYGTPGDAVWVAKDGRSIRLADMSAGHLALTHEMLLQRNGHALLERTPLGRAFAAERAARTATPRASKGVR